MANQSSTLPESSSCLAEETIRDYLCGQTDDLRAFEIEMHLAQCQRCEQAASKIDGQQDSWAGLLAKAGAATESPLPTRLTDVFARIKNLSAEPSVRPSSLASLVGKTVGPYQLEEPLGQGGMGVVFRARHQLLGKQFALKILPGGDSLSDEAFERFRREIAASGRLHHPSIVAATDAGEHAGLHYLAMEILDGLNVARIARRLGPLAVAEACEIIRQAALGLAHAHAAGVVHRDIKPSNLMLAPRGQVKILDFGLAQLNAWNDPASELTTVGQLLGTLDYMAPEQAERGTNVDHRADLYSLGATLYALLSGRAPYAATPRQSPLEKLRLMATELPPRITTLCSELPDALAELIHRLIERHADRRPSSAALVAEEIAPLAQGADLVGLLEKATSVAEPADPNVAPQITPQLTALNSPVAARDKNPPRRSKWPLAALFGFFGLLAALGILIVIETSKGQLIIETDAANVQVKLLADGKEYDQLQLHPGANATRLFAGKYEIVIDGATDQYALDRDTIALRRGETIVARVTLNPKDSNRPKPLDGVGPNPLFSSVVPPQNGVYDGKTLRQWLEVLLGERNDQQSNVAAQAIRYFSSERERFFAFDVIMKAIESAQDDDFRVDLGGNNLLVAIQGMRFDNAQITRLVSLLDPSSPKKTRWALSLLNMTFQNLNSKSKEPLLASIANLLAHEKVNPDDEIAVDAGRLLVQFINGNDEDLSPDAMGRAIQLLTTSGKLGPVFWTESFAVEMVLPDSVVARQREVITNALTDPNVPPQTVTLVLYAINQFSWASEFAGAINSLADRTGSSTEPSLIATLDVKDTSVWLERRGGGEFGRPQSRTQETEKSIRVLLKNDRIQFQSYRELYPALLGIELVAAIGEQRATTAEEKAKRLESIANASRDGFDRFAEAMRSVDVAAPVLIDVNEFSAISKSGRLSVSKQDLAKTLVFVAAKSALDKLQPPSQVDKENRELSIKTQVDRDPSAATYGGRSLNEWLDVFRTDQDPKTIRECVDAIEQLVTDANKASVRATIIEYFAEMDDMPVIIDPQQFYEELEIFSAKEQLLLSLGELDSNAIARLKNLLIDKDSKLTPPHVHKAGWAAGVLTALCPRDSKERESILAALFNVLDRPDIHVDSELARLYGTAALNIASPADFGATIDPSRFDSIVQRLEKSDKLGPEFWLCDAAVRRAFGQKTKEMGKEIIQYSESPQHLRIKAYRALTGMVAASKTVPPEILATVRAVLRSVVNGKGFLAVEQTPVIRINNSPTFWNLTVTNSNLYPIFAELQKEGMSVQDIQRSGATTGGVFTKSNSALELIGLCEVILANSSEPDVLEGLTQVVSATQERHAIVVRHFDQTIRTGDYKNCWVEPDLQSIRFNTEPATKVTMDDFMAFLIHRSAARAVEMWTAKK